MDSYQAIYDAVRSRISGADVGSIIEDVVREKFDISYQISNCLSEITREHTDVAVLYRPKLFLDGNQWCALYGNDLQEGVAGFGDSPAAAMADFSCKWWSQIKSS